MPKTTGRRDSEKYLVARLAKKIPSIGSFGTRAVRLGIGDDSAVLRPSAKSEFVVTCDFSLEGVHFRDATHPAASIGYRCLARATSDIAAMGARPRYFLLALALPSSRTAKWLDSFASGLGRAARELGLLLIGGDITVSPSITICVTIIGELPVGQAISRSGARPGDLIYVTGTLGAAQLGLELLLGGLSHLANRTPQSAGSAAPKGTSFRGTSSREARWAQYRNPQTPIGSGRQAPELQALLQPHLYPRIPIAFAQALSRRSIPSAMMDISDGLSTDLARVCESSRAGARFFADKLPLVDIPPAITHDFLDYHPERSEESAFTRHKATAQQLQNSHPHSARLEERHTTIHCHPERSEGSAFRLFDPLQLALHGGEDYALLFTVPPKRVPLLRSIAAKTKTRITYIGEITRSRKILLIDSSGRSTPLEPHGWNPFATKDRE